MGRSWRMRVRTVACVVLSLVAAGARAEGPDQVGRWSAEEIWPLTDTHSHLLPTGKVMFLGEYDEGMGSPYLWDPATDQLTAIAAPPYNVFCAGEAFLGHGSLLFTGGHDMSHVGLAHAVLLDPQTLTWTQLPDMNDKRWYPTTTALPDGRGITLSGETDAAGTSDGLPQIWNPPTGSWVDLTNAYLALPYYPRMFVAPNGRLFMAGPEALSRWLDVAGTGAWINGPRTVSPESRTYGTSVMYEPGKILIVGGGVPPLASAETIDLDAPAPAWRSTDPMHFPRRQLNATLLPDGRVLVTGGSCGATFDDPTCPVLASEVWDPSTGHWTVWASQASYHGYHATATLLPDGRVQMGGGSQTFTEQVFSPPYLFKGPRPTISSAPQSVVPGRSFFVGTPDAASVSQVTLVRLTAVTHAFNMNQRFNRLSFSRLVGGLEVAAPADNNLAPAGDYLLFVINGKGVPSVAAVIRLAAAADGFTHPIVFSDSWKFDDSGVDRGAAWTSPTYDDSRWKVGNGQLGYGEGDEATQIANHGPTAYFRKQFRVDGSVSAASLDLVVDDGVAVWVNGSQVFSSNLGNGAAYSAYASAPVHDQFLRADLTTAPFVQGTNTIAVEVKRAASGTNLSFALALNLQVHCDAPTCSAIQSPDGGVDGSCASDAQCSAGQICSAGHCVLPPIVRTDGGTGEPVSPPGPGDGAASAGPGGGCDVGGVPLVSLWPALLLVVWRKRRARPRRRSSPDA